MSRHKHYIRRWLFAGLMVLVPLGITLFVVDFLVGLVDKSLLLVPPALRPEALLGFSVPGIGIVLILLLVLAVGFLADNFIGARVVRWAESMLGRVPLVRSVYSGSKQLADMVLGEGGTSFRQVILVEYPRKGLWTIAFITGGPLWEAREKTGRELATVFVPTTPNPTSGFIILVPREDILTLDMSVEEAMRMIISLGVATPDATPVPAGQRTAAKSKA
ncbi:MAG TPA: DUF502 domain-containing protein [Nevskiales bacterium]|nr:DUF502 domain-containing protein [Nevskiales bacterium]